MGWTGRIQTLHLLELLEALLEEELVEEGVEEVAQEEGVLVEEVLVEEMLVDQPPAQSRGVQMEYPSKQAGPSRACSTGELRLSCCAPCRMATSENR